MTLQQLSLEIDPTPAMLDGTQTVWQCTWCGCVVVLTSLAKVKRPRQCPGHDETGTWTRQALPVAGLRPLTVAVDLDDLEAIYVFMLAERAQDKGYRLLMGRIEEAMEEATGE